MGWFGNWTRHASSIPWWTPDRPLRLATDCSGLGVPEIAARMLAGDGRSTHVAFACDVWKGSKVWLQQALAPLLLMDMNLRIWNTKTGMITTKDTDGNKVSITKEGADLDLYVCGFMCTPFTPSGERKGWHEETPRHSGRL